MAKSGHVDTFARDNLPPRAHWPEFKFDLPELQYPERLNCVSELRRQLGRGRARRSAVPDLAPTETLTYAQLAERMNRIANVLTRDLGMVPGNRVLLRAPNNPMMVAAYLAVIKAGGVVVATMPLLRAKELSYPLTKAKIALALCDARLADEMEKARAQAPDLAAHRLLGQRRAGCARSADGASPATRLHRLRHRERRRLPDRVHLGHHRRAEGHDAFPPRHAGDLRQLRQARAARRSATTVFIGSPPLAFTFGLGGLVLFPLRIGAATVLLEKAGAGRAARRRSRNIGRRSASPRRPPTAPCSASSPSTTSRRCANACRPARRCRRRRSTPGTRRPASRSSTASARPRCCTSSSARPSTRCAPARPARPVPGYEARVLDDAGNVAAARHGRPPCGARTDRLPLSRRRRARRNTCRTAGTSPATPT